MAPLGPYLNQVYEPSKSRYQQLTMITSLVVLAMAGLELIFSGQIPLIFIGGFAIAAGLSFTKFNRASVLLLVMTFLALPFSALQNYDSATNAPVTAYFMWSSIPIIIAGLLLPIRSLIMVSTLKIVAIITLPLYHPSIGFDDINEPVGYLCTIAIIVVIVMWQRNEFERDSQSFLADREAIVQSALDAAQIGTWIWNSHTGKLSSSPQVAAIFGYEPDQFSNSTDFILQHLPEDQRDAVVAEITASFQERREFYALDHKILRQDGQVAWVTLRGQLSTNDSNGHERLLGTISDITERKVLEQTANERASQFSALYEMSLAVNRQADFSASLKEIINQSLSLLRTKRALLTIYDHEREVFRVAADHHLPTNIRDKELRIGEGLVGQTALRNEVVIIENYAEWGDRVAEVNENQIGRAIGLPLKHIGETLGVLCLFDEAPGSFDDNAIKLLELFASYAAITLANRQYLSDQQYQREVAEGLNRVSRTVNSAINLEDVLELVLRELEVVLSYDAAHIILLDGDQASMVAARNFAGHDQFFGKAEPIDNLRLSAKAINIQKPLLIPDTSQEPLFSPTDEASQMARNLILAPLIYKNESIGILTILSHTANQYTAVEAELAFRFAQQVAIAIANAQLVREISMRRDDLETRVAERTAELAKAKDEAEEANRTKSRFLANVTHELRTPLNAILGFTSMLQKDSSDPEQIEKLATIRTNGIHLLNLITDVLDRSKIEAGRVTVNESLFNLDEMVSDVVKVIRYSARNKGLQLIVKVDEPLPSTIYSDRSKLSQILLNLLSNAVKFTGAGTISLHVFADTITEHTGTLHFTVSDTGVGISPEEYDLLFKPFSQTSSGKQALQGTGLGLTITAEYAKLLGGKVTFASQQNKGSSFFVELPVKFEQLTDKSSKHATHSESNLTEIDPVHENENMADFFRAVPKAWLTDFEYAARSSDQSQMILLADQLAESFETDPVKKLINQFATHKLIQAIEQVKHDQ